MITVEFIRYEETNEPVQIGEVVVYGTLHRALCVLLLIHSVCAFSIVFFGQDLPRFVLLCQFLLAWCCFRTGVSFQDASERFRRYLKATAVEKGGVQ